MPVTRGAFPPLLTPGLYRAYADEYESLPASYPEVFNVTSTERAFEEIVVTSGLGTTPSRGEGVNVAMDRPFLVGTVKMNILGYGLGYEITKEAIDDDLYNVLGQPASRFLAQSGRDTEERMAWALLNGAFTTTEAYDGVPIISVAHPLKGGGTYANRPVAAQALGVTALQASSERYQLLVNERGLRIRMSPMKLVVPVQLKWLADEILMSNQKPFTANNEPNVVSSGRLGVTAISSPYLTSPTAWFMLADKARHKLMFFWREKPNNDDDYDKKARILTFMNFFRFGTAAFDWRGIDGSP